MEMHMLKSDMKIWRIIYEGGLPLCLLGLKTRTCTPKSGTSSKE